jgi:hypothetical protein
MKFLICLIDSKNSTNMKKILLILLFIIIGSNSFSQLPGPVIGTAVAIPAGSFACTQQSFGTPIGVSGEPSQVTMCFSYLNIGPINLSYLLVNGLCGPFPLYNTLSFEIYNSSGTQLITSGTIVPVSSNATISILTPSTLYNICYTWTPNCAQFSACPLIYTSALPVELLNFEGSYNPIENVNELMWSTATERNSDYFELTKSYDLITFFDPVRIESNGNSTTLSQYSYIDSNFERNKTIYYKLTEVDFDGYKEDLSIISINSFYENNLEIEIFDVLGKKQTDFINGVNIIKRGDKYSKVIKINGYGN